MYTFWLRCRWRLDLVAYAGDLAAALRACAFDDDAPLALTDGIAWFELSIAADQADKLLQMAD